jgi:hypothetical protein
MSADSVAPAPDSRGLNRYAYAANNPLRYNDPTGHCFNGLECSEWISLQWIACGISGLCRAGSQEDYANIRRLARWALSQREFFDHVQGYLKSDGDVYRQAVEMFKTTLEGAAVELSAKQRSITPGEPGAGVGAQPAGLPKIPSGSNGPPVPVGFDKDDAYGVVSWKITFSYLSYTLSAAFEQLSGDPKAASRQVV